MNGNKIMREIKAKLTQIEQQKNIRILYACESGSRAWGFASPDSDYDVRAVYVKPLDWYLGLDEKPSDTFSAMLPDDIDISAWELRKALRQMLKSNASFMEWLGSPIVYRDSGLLAQLNELKDRVFNPVAGAFHYASMLRHALDDRSADGSIGVKKLCYALRAGLCVRWSMEHDTMPPTAFAAVRRGVSLSGEADFAIDRLLELKASACEKDRIVPDSALVPLVEDCFGQLGEHPWRRTANDIPAARFELEAVFRSQLSDLCRAKI